MAKASSSRIRWIMVIVVLGITVVKGFGAWQMRAAADANGGIASLTQDPNLYAGDTKRAYTVARDHPEIPSAAPFPRD